MIGDEQAAIVELKPSARTVVLAAAGTGKTEAAVRRLVWLTEHHELVPGVELLVLSFSRAAVAEARRRLRLVGPSVAPIKLATIDSFASRLLRLYAPTDDWMSQDYDGRIRSATTLVMSSQLARGEVAEYRHVIVDEIQDLVGDRGEFILSLLSGLHSDSGFTVLGDPAQGIYDFQLKGSTSQLAARELLRRILDMEPLPEVRALTYNHRAKSAGADLAAAHGAAIRQSLVDGTGIGAEERSGLAQLVAGLDVYRNPAAAKLLERRSAREGLIGAVLCRNNAQALVVSGEFVAAGVPHRLQQPAEHPTVAPWLARALLGFEFASLSRGQFERLLERVDVPHPDPSPAWAALRRLAGAASTDLPVRWISGNIRNGRLDGVLVEHPDTPLVVSSVHRAKGLEWDIVLICGLDPGAVELEPSLAYVALTRTRDEVYALADPDTRGMTTHDQPDGRWIRGQSWNHLLLQVQLMHSDVHRMDPAGSWVLEADVLATQAYLSTHVRPDDPVDLVKVRSSVEGEARAVYRIDHHGVAIGVTSEEFARAIWRNVSVGGTVGRGFPTRLVGARVYAIEAVGGSTAAGRSAGIGSSGVWLAPRLHGLADVLWEEART